VVVKRPFTVNPGLQWWQSPKDEEIDTGTLNADEGSEAEQAQSPFGEIRDVNTVPRRIYILGANIPGVFVAHSLAGLPNPPPLTLLFPQHRLLRLWEEQDRALRVTTHRITEKRYGFDAEIRQRWNPEPSPQAGQTTHSNHFSSPSRISQSNESSVILGRESSLGEPALQTDNAGLDAEVLEDKRSDKEDFHYKRSRSKGPQTNPDDARLQPTGQPIQDLPEYSDTSSNFESRWPQDPEQEQAYEYGATSAPDRNGQPGAETSKSEGRRRGSGSEEQNEEETIYNLIVTVPGHRTVSILRGWAHRLTKESTILFLRNAMGVLDEVKTEIFPDPLNRPTFIQGVMTHGLYSNGLYDVRHDGRGTLALAIMPHQFPPKHKDVSNGTSASSRYLMRTMTRTPVFVAVGMGATSLFQQQLDRLVVSAILGPLTALLDIKTGALLSNFHMTRVMRLLLAEISLVIRSLPELRNVPNVNVRFDTIRLEQLVVQIAKLTADQLTDMAEDMRNGESTDIDYVTGYIIKRGEEMGVHCVMNYMLMHMVKGKRNMLSQNLIVELPLQKSIRRHN